MANIVASSVPQIACVLFAALCLAGPVYAAEKKASAAATTADVGLPSSVMRFRPSGSRRAWLITEIRVQPKALRPGHAAVGEPPDSGDYESIFSGAVLFERDLGVRIVPRSSKSSSLQPDYIEIRRNGTGYGVSADTESAKAQVYVSGLKLAPPKEVRFGDVVPVSAIVDIEYPGGTTVRRVSAQLEMKARLAEDFSSGRSADISKLQPGGGTPVAPAEKTSKSGTRKKPDTSSD